MAGGARKSGVLLGPRSLLFRRELKGIATAPRHRVNVAHKRPAHGALGAGLDFLTQNRFKQRLDPASLGDESAGLDFTWLAPRASHRQFRREMF